MQSNFRLISALMRGVWFIEPGYAEEQLPVIDRLLAGQVIGYGQHTPRAEEGATVYAVAPSATTFQAHPYRSYDNAPHGAVAVIPVHGVIMREDFCGDIGTDSRIQLLQAAAAHPNIAAIVLDTNSPGGEASGLATFWDAVAQARTQKPVLGFVNDGMAASAGYFPISGADEVYVSHGHCGVGSIGCVLFLTDSSKADENAGRKRIAVYAPQSTDKNKDFSEALAGRPDLLKNGMLKAWCGDFISRVQLGRGERLDPAAGDPFTGKMYWDATESQALGLIDGVLSFQGVVQRALELAEARTTAAGDPAPTDDTTQPTFSTPPMAHTRLLALLGLSMALEATKDGTHLQAAHLDLIEAALGEKETALNDLATANEARTKAESDLATMTTRATTAEATAAKYHKGPAAAAAAPVQTGPDRIPAADTEEPVISAEVEEVLRLKAEMGIPNE